MNLSTTERSFLFLCILAALLALGIGYGFRQTGSDILKDFMLFAAGSGIAYVLARAGARATSLDRVRSLCNRSVQRLGLTASRVRETAAQLREYAHSASSPQVQIAFMLDALAEQAEVSIGDLEEMAGARIGLDPLVSTALQGAKAAAEEAPAPTKEKLLSAIKTIEEQVSAVPRPLLPALPSSLPIDVSPPLMVTCAQCGESVPASLKMNPGSTVFVYCRKCNARLSVHRGANKQVIVSTVPRISIECPTCRNHMGVILKPNHGKTIVRNCFHCNGRLFIDAATATVVRSEIGKPLESTYGISGVSAIITCPNCAFAVKIKPPENHAELKANCPECTSLIIANFDGNSPTAA